MRIVVWVGYVGGIREGSRVRRDQYLGSLSCVCGYR